MMCVGALMCCCFDALMCVGALVLVSNYAPLTHTEHISTSAHHRIKSAHQHITSSHHQLSTLSFSAHHTHPRSGTFPEYYCLLWPTKPITRRAHNTPRTVYRNRAHRNKKQIAQHIQYSTAEKNSRTTEQSKEQHSTEQHSAAKSMTCVIYIRTQQCVMPPM